MSKWIDAKKSKPKSGTESVVFNGDVMYGVWYWNYGENDVWTTDYSGDIHGVTYWMQPEPPK